MSNYSPLPEREDLNEPATRGDLIKLFIYMKKWKKDMRRNGGRDIVEAIERHELRCPSHQKTELKRKGVIKDSEEYVKRHPWVSVGVLSSISTALIKLILELI